MFDLTAADWCGQDANAYHTLTICDQTPDRRTALDIVRRLLLEYRASSLLSVEALLTCFFRSCAQSSSTGSAVCKAWHSQCRGGFRYASTT